MKELFKQSIYIYLLVMLGIRVVILGANISDAIIMLGLIGLYAYSMYLKKLEIKDINSHVLEEVKRLSNDLSSLSVKQVFTPKSEGKKFF